MMNLILKANNGGKKSRTILIEMKLEPTAIDKVKIVIHSVNWFINYSPVLLQFVHCISFVSMHNLVFIFSFDLVVAVPSLSIFYF